MGFRTKAIGVVGAAAVAASGFIFSQRSLNNLETTCPAPQELSHCALSRSEVDFIVIEGYRSQERQNKSYARGRTEPGTKVTWTLNSRHTKRQAIDLVAYVDGGITWEPKYYYKINEAFDSCSKDLNIDYRWGGWFKGRDYVHFETKHCQLKD